MGPEDACRWNSCLSRVIGQLTLFRVSSRVIGRKPGPAGGRVGLSFCLADLAPVAAEVGACGAGPAGRSFAKRLAGTRGKGAALSTV